MFIWFGKKGFMRGPVWFLFLIGSFAGILGGIAMMATEGVDAGGIVVAAISIIYIAAYFVIPKRHKAPAKTAETINRTPLSVPATLTIIRDSSVAGAAMPTIISLDGKQVCTLKNAEKVQILLYNQQSVLTTNAVGSKNVRYVIEAKPGGSGSIHVKAGAFLPKTMQMESAGRMQEKYPLPKTIEEAKPYVFGGETDASKEKAYTLETGLNELVALFRSYPQLDQKKIQTVGQKIYDADIPLVSGVGGMHQLYARFKERMPMYGAELSRIWDGIGDWAD